MNDFKTIVLDTNVLGTALKDSIFLKKINENKLVVLIPCDVFMERLDVNPETNQLVYCGVKEIVEFAKQSNGRVQFFKPSEEMLKIERLQNRPLNNINLISTEDEFQDWCRLCLQLHKHYEERIPLNPEETKEIVDFKERKKWYLENDKRLRNFITKEKNITDKNIESLLNQIGDDIYPENFIGEYFFDNQDNKKWKDWCNIFKQDPKKYRICYSSVYLLQQLVHTAVTHPKIVGSDNPNRIKKNNWVDRLILSQSLYSDYFITDESDLIKVGNQIKNKLGLNLKVSNLNDFLLKI